MTIEYTRGKKIAWPAFTSCSTGLSKSNVSSFGSNQSTTASTTLVIDVQSAALLGPLNPYGENEVLLAPRWEGEVVGTLRRDQDFIPDGLEVAGFSTILHLKENGFQPLEEHPTPQEWDNFDDVLRIAIDHDTRLPIHARIPFVADAYYARALQLRPKNARACSNYATFLAEVRGQNDKAAAYFDRALALVPHDSELHYSYATFLMHRKSDDQLAATHFEEAIRIMYLDAVMHADRMELLQNEPGTIRAFSIGASRTEMEYTAACSNYADLLYNQLNDFVRAEQFYERAVERDSTFTYLMTACQNLMQECGLASFFAEKMAQVNNSRAKSCNAYGTFLLDTRKGLPKALKLFKRAIAANPNFAMPYSNCGIILGFHHHQIDEAMEYFEKAIQLDPSYAKACRNYGRLLLASAPPFCDVERADELLLRAVTLEPSVKDCCDFGDRFFRLGKPEKALVYYEKAARRDHIAALWTSGCFSKMLFNFILCVAKLFERQNDL